MNGLLVRKLIKESIVKNILAASIAEVIGEIRRIDPIYRGTDGRHNLPRGEWSARILEKYLHVIQNSERDDPFSIEDLQSIKKASDMINISGFSLDRAKKRLDDIIRTSIADKRAMINEGLLDDVGDTLKGAYNSTKDAIGDVFDDIGEFFSSLYDDATEFGKKLIDDLKKYGSDAINSSLSEADYQRMITDAVKVFATQEDLKEFLKTKVKKPAGIDALFVYLKRKGVNLEDLAVKVVANLIKADVLVIDLSKSPPADIKKGKGTSEVVASAVVDSLEELDANFGRKLFKKKRVGAKAEKAVTKKILKHRLKKLLDEAPAIEDDEIVPMYDELGEPNYEHPEDVKVDKDLEKKKEKEDKKPERKPKKKDRFKVFKNRKDKVK